MVIRFTPSADPLIWAKYSNTLRWPRQPVPIVSARPRPSHRSVNATCVAIHSETEPGQGHRPGAIGSKPAQVVAQFAGQACVAGFAGPGACTVVNKSAHAPLPPPGSPVNVNKVSVDQFACKLDDVISLFGKNMQM